MKIQHIIEKLPFWIGLRGAFSPSFLHFKQSEEGLVCEEKLERKNKKPNKKPEKIGEKTSPPIFPIQL